jgi:hypothetical protein
LGYYVSAEVVYTDGSVWTINFPEFPTISPISFTESGKPPFTVSFAVDAGSFTFSADYENEVTTVQVVATGFPKWDVILNGRGQAISTFPDLTNSVYAPFSKKYTWGLIGNIGYLRDTCAKARALMMPAGVDTTDQGDSYLTAAVAMYLIPPGLQINVENLASIAWLAESFMPVLPVSYPLRVATGFFFGDASGVYDTLISALNPFIGGEGAPSNPPTIPKPLPIKPEPKG